jgi:hypothetical protein
MQWVFVAAGQLISTALWMMLYFLNSFRIFHNKTNNAKESK